MKEELQCAIKLHLGNYPNHYLPNTACMCQGTWDQRGEGSTVLWRGVVCCLGLITAYTQIWIHSSAEMPLRTFVQRPSGGEHYHHLISQYDWFLQKLRKLPYPIPDLEKSEPARVKKAAKQVRNRASKIHLHVFSVLGSELLRIKCNHKALTEHFKGPVYQSIKHFWVKFGLRYLTTAETNPTWFWQGRRLRQALSTQVALQKLSNSNQKFGDLTAFREDTLKQGGLWKNTNNILLLQEWKSKQE